MSYRIFSRRLKFQGSKTKLHPQKNSVRIYEITTNAYRKNSRMIMYYTIVNFSDPKQAEHDLYGPIYFFTLPITASGAYRGMT
jgi:hypothetical protein